MDDGYVIPGLNEGYTLAGAKIMEWVSGIMMAMVLQSVLNINLARSGPLWVIIGLSTTFVLAASRRAFPDEERGLRNSCMVSLGFIPPGLPAPAIFRPYWSGAPLREQPRATYFSQLGLERVVGASQQQDDSGSIFIQHARQKAA